LLEHHYEQLTNTVASLQNNVSVLTRKVNNLDSGRANVSAAAGSEAQAHSIGEANISQGSSRSDEEIFTLQSAFSRHVDTGVVTNNSIQEPIQGNYVKTKYGFAAESLPFVETVSPKLRKDIQEGKDVNLASLLIPSHDFSSDSNKSEKTDPRLYKDLSIAAFIHAVTKQ